MHTHHMPTDQYHSTPETKPPGARRDNYDAWIVGAIIAAVVVLFGAYMWQTAAHYSDQSNSTPATETGTDAGTNNANTIAPAPDNGANSTTPDTSGAVTPSPDNTGATPNSTTTR